ncbi:hypothetical protein B0J18DRAFT_439401 [Chaetomium sp. MPI-SDFR-AT-0129]|nr:hypothetical protein B0J18DRAFT_439401 [Chaetomium sp. MPI-SDFR-AT-0129]
MPISHTGIKTTPALHQATLAWYEAALAPLGYRQIIAFQDGLVVGFGDGSGIPDWWVSSAAAVSPGREPEEGAAEVAKILGTHTAFLAKDREAVDAFYEAALAAGGKTNGAPGVRERYSPTYYAAFVLDPAGNNIEVVSTVAV